MSHEDNQKELYDLRQKVREGKDVSEDEYTRIISNLRQSRTAATGGSKTKKKKEPKHIPENMDLNDLFNTPVAEASS